MALAKGITPDCEEWGAVCVGADGIGSSPLRDSSAKATSCRTIVRQPSAEGKGLESDSCTESHMPLVVSVGLGGVRRRDATTTVGGTPALRTSPRAAAGA